MPQYHGAQFLGLWWSTSGDVAISVGTGYPEGLCICSLQCRDVRPHSWRLAPPSPKSGCIHYARASRQHGSTIVVTDPLGTMVVAKCFVCGESDAGTVPAATGAKGNCLLSAHEKCFCIHQCYMVISQDE